MGCGGGGVAGTFKCALRTDEVLMINYCLIKALL